MSRSPRVALAFLVVLALLLLAAHGAWLRVPLVDDAATSVAYGITLAGGAGLRLTPFSQVVEGFSNPLWTFALSFAPWLHLDPMRLASGLGEGLALAALAAFSLWGTAARGDPRVEDAAGALLAASTTSYAYWACSGMETGLFALLLGASGALLLRELRRGRGALSGVALGALCLTRPEAPLYVAVAAVLWVVWRAREGKRPGRQELAQAIGIVSAFGAYLLFRKAYFDAWLPNTYYAKIGSDFHAKAYVEGFASTHPWVLGAGGAFALVAIACGPVSARRQALLGLGFVTAGLAFTVVSTGDWMHEWRFFAPLVPCWGQCVGAGLTAIRDRANRRERLRALVPLAACAALAAWAGEGWTTWKHGPELRADPELPAQRVAQNAREVVEHAAWVGLVHPRVAFPDIGGLALTMRHAEIVDTGLLADAALTLHRQNPRAAEDYLASEVLPDYVDAHGPSGYVTGFARLMADYTPFLDVNHETHLGDGIWVRTGLNTTDDPRCPGGRAAVLALGAAALVTRLEAAMDGGRPDEALHTWRCAFAYRVEDDLPGPSWRASAADRADMLSHAREEAGEIEPALRYASLAAVLSRGDPRRRHRAERLRERLFPPR